MLLLTCGYEVCGFGDQGPTFPWAGPASGLESGCPSPRGETWNDSLRGFQVTVATEPPSPPAHQFFGILFEKKPARQVPPRLFPGLTFWLNLSWVPLSRTLVALCLFKRRHPFLRHFLMRKWNRVCSTLSTMSEILWVFCKCLFLSDPKSITQGITVLGRAWSEKWLRLMQLWPDLQWAGPRLWPQLLASVSYHSHPPWPSAALICPSLNTYVPGEAERMGKGRQD